MKNVKMIAVSIAVACALAGCATGENMRADVYHAGNLNQEQEVEIVNILMVAPAKVAVDNSENKKKAQVAAAANINTYGVLNAGAMVVTESALNVISEVLA